MSSVECHIDPHVRIWRVLTGGPQEELGKLLDVRIREAPKIQRDNLFDPSHLPAVGSSLREHRPSLRDRYRL